MTPKELAEELAKLKPEERASIVAPLFDDADTTGAVLAQVNAVKKRILTQDYVNDTVIPAVKAGTVKTKDHEELKAEHDRVVTELKKLKETPPDQNPDVKAQLEQNNAQWAARLSELEQQINSEREQREAVEAQRIAIAESHTLQAAMQAAGVAKGMENQASLIAKRDIPNLQLFEDNGKSKMVIHDPLTKQNQDAGPALAAWVEQNKHFAKPNAPGGGLPSAGPGPAPAPKNPMEGMTSTQRMEYALRHDPMFKSRNVDIDKLPIIGEAPAATNPSQGDTD